MPVMSYDPVDVSFFPQTLLFVWFMSLSSGSTPGTLGSTGLEAVLELASNGAEVPHAAGTGGLSSLSLLGPVVCGCRYVSLGSSLTLLSPPSVPLDRSQGAGVDGTYTCGSWRQGNRTRRRCESGCAWNGDRNDGRCRGSCCGYFDSVSISVGGSKYSRRLSSRSSVVLGLVANIPLAEGARSLGCPAVSSMSSSTDGRPRKAVAKRARCRDDFVVGKRMRIEVRDWCRQRFEIQDSGV
jgi:hypothetical protein